ncbi:MAG: glycosyltransferase involved in cell wall biosynthesis [Bacteroidia bacterium]|jgi:glycosyltransferase involved in cell wall biosynthesis
MEGHTPHLKISVLMPAYNAAKYIEEAIQGILSQTYANYELLICDDASTDSTLVLASKYDDIRIKIYRNESNKGKPLTVNRLFKYATGEVITIHDADDISLPKRFETIIQVFDTTSYKVCGHVIERISENGKTLGLYRPKVSDPNLIKHMMEFENTDGDPSLFFTREVAESLNGLLLRPYFPNNMDYDMALRMIDNFSFTNVLDVLSYYRNVPNSISKGIYSYKKLVTQKMTQFFAEERREKGKDSLMEKNYLVIEEMEIEYSKKYIKDKTLYYRQMASFYMYVKMEKQAIQYMLQAVWEEPLKFKNWHTLIYCLRKILFGI